MLTSARCESACGKLPRNVLLRGRTPRQKADVVAQCEQPFEQDLGLIVAALHRIVLGEPEAADQESALARRKAVLGLPRVVAHDEAVAHQLALDRRNRAAHARVVGGRKPKSGITSALASSSVEPNACTKAPDRGRSRRADLGVDARPATPSSRSTRPSSPNPSTALMARSTATHAMTFECVKCCASSPHLPDALVGLRPNAARDARAGPSAGSSRPRCCRACIAGEMERVHHLAEDVELELVECGVADPNRLRAAETLQPGHLPLVRGGARRRCRRAAGSGTACRRRRARATRARPAPRRETRP